MNDSQLLIGLVAIALTIFFGVIAIALTIFFGLKGLPKDVLGELSRIKEAVIAIRTTVEKTWDLMLRQSAQGGGTVERQLENLGKVRITAEPGKDNTSYLIEIEKPLLKEGPLYKIVQEPDFVKQEGKILGQQSQITVLSPNRMRFNIPCTDPKPCTEFVTFLLKELNSTYVESLKEIKKFEESILT